MLKIQVKTKYVLGNEVYVPVCNKAKEFAKLAGTPHLTPNCIQIIKNLGYIIQQAA